MVTSSANARATENTHGSWRPEFTFGDHLRRVRRSLDMGQREFSEKLQQKLGTYQLWEADISKPRDMVAIAKRVEMLTGVSAAWILGLESTMPHPASPSGATARPEGFEPPTFWLGVSKANEPAPEAPDADVISITRKASTRSVRRPQAVGA